MWHSRRENGKVEKCHWSLIILTILLKRLKTHETESNSERQPTWHLRIENWKVEKCHWSLIILTILPKQ